MRDAAQPEGVARVPVAAAFAVACVGIATFSCMDAVMKALSTAHGVYRAMLWRSVAGLVLSGVLFVVAGGRWPDRATLRLHAQRSVSASISVLLFFWGLVRVPMAEAVALTFLAPVLAILLAAPMLGERIRASALACAVAVAGVLVIAAGQAAEQAGPDALRGIGAIVLASLFYAYSLVQLRQSAQRAGPIEIVFLTNVVLFAMFGLGAPFLGALPPFGAWPAILLATVLAIVSALLLAWAYARAEAQQLVPVEYTAFIWAAILGAIVFGEHLAAATLAGAALIVGGCLVATRRDARPGPEAAT